MTTLTSFFFSKNVFLLFFSHVFAKCNGGIMMTCTVGVRSCGAVEGLVGRI